MTHVNEGSPSSYPISAVTLDPEGLLLGISLSLCGRGYDWEDGISLPMVCIFRSYSAAPYGSIYIPPVPSCWDSLVNLARQYIGLLTAFWPPFLLSKQGGEGGIQ